MGRLAERSRLTARGATLLRQIGVLPARLSGSELTDFLRAYEPKCPVQGCGKAIKSVVQVQRKGKYGQVYEYLRLRHHDARKSDSRAYCYVKLAS